MLIHFITVTIIINIIIVLIFVYLLLVVLMRGRERFHNSGGMCVVEFESNFLLFFDYFSRTIDDTNCKYFCSVSVTFKTSHSNSQLFSILFISVNYIFFRSSLIFFWERDQLAVGYHGFECRSSLYFFLINHVLISLSAVPIFHLSYYIFTCKRRRKKDKLERTVGKELLHDIRNRPCKFARGVDLEHVSRPLWRPPFGPRGYQQHTAPSALAENSRVWRALVQNAFVIAIFGQIAPNHELSLRSR